MKQDRIGWLDMLRGLAAVVVVFYHYHAVFHVPHAGYGFIAVDVFFALSGAILALKYAPAIEAGMTLVAFMKSRLQRLYPMVFIAGILCFALNLADVDGASSSIYVFALLPQLGTTNSFPADPPMWSLWAELVVNVLWFLALRLGRPAVWATGACSMIALFFLAAGAGTLNIGWQATPGGLGTALVRAMAWFVCGYGVVRLDLPKAAASRVLLAALLLSAAAISLLHQQQWAKDMLVAAAGVALLPWLLKLPAPGRRMAIVGQSLGLASFPLYLIHLPLLRLVQDGNRPKLTAVVLLVAGTFIATVINEKLVAVVRGRRAKIVLPEIGAVPK
jgi:peptidoglycan/LPS O-acetylase OafA/YrhL